MPKLIYDDFYKFVTSFAVLSFILSVYACYQQIVKSNVLGVTKKEVEFFVMFFYIFLVFAIISVLFFIWAVRKWKKNQDKLDVKLDAETTLKLLELKKESTNYEKQVNELVKVEPLFPSTTFTFLKELQRTRVEKKVKKNLVHDKK